MSDGARILVVDDTPLNVKLLADLLRVKGFAVTSAASGQEALDRIATERPDLVLLDVMMPEMSGYEVCSRIRANVDTARLPVVMVTSLDAVTERVKGIEAGADDFLSKPVNQPELLARVRSLLRIKELDDELARLNRDLEQRVTEQVSQLDRLGRLKRFFSPQLAELIVVGGADDPLKSHRRDITVVFLDLRGFTAFTETADPEDVMAVLGEYHAAVGALVLQHEATLERFTGDGIMVFFNDPLPLSDPALCAVRMALEMQREVAVLAAGWRRRGYELAMGVGIAQGFATLGGIGFPGRIDYGAIGTVTNLAARLCGEALGGEILVSRRAWASIEDRLDAQRDGLACADPAGEFTLKGFHRPVPAFRLIAR